MSTLRDDSRKNWSATGKFEDINAGSLQRIADATELMAKRYLELIDERDRLRRIYDAEREAVCRLRSSNAALRGVITRMRKVAR